MTKSKIGDASSEGELLACDNDCAIIPRACFGKNAVRPHLLHNNPWRLMWLFFLTLTGPATQSVLKAENQCGPDMGQMDDASACASAAELMSLPTAFGWPGAFWPQFSL